MTTEKQNIAIAALCGWRECWVCLCGCGDLIGKYGTGIHWKTIPPYTSDLNACAEMEKSMTGEQWAEYEDFLPEPTFRATAAQRAESFLRVHGKWEEVE